MPASWATAATSFQDQMGDITNTIIDYIAHWFALIPHHDMLITLLIISVVGELALFIWRGGWFIFNKARGSGGQG